MKQTHTLRQILNSLPIVILGNILYALTVKLFLLPGELVTGGTNGIAMTINHFYSIPISLFVLIFNVIMLCIGWLILGRAFAVTTIASSFLYPLFLEIFNQIFGDLVLTNDLLLNTIFCGLGVGISLGLIIRSGSSTGGMDIPPLVLNKKLRIPVSVGLYGFDGLILLSQIFYRPVENVLYGIVLLLIYPIIIDKMMTLGNSRTELKIVSTKSAEICAAILTQVDRGVTLLDGKGGFSGEKTEVVLSVISSRELFKLEKLVHQIDPECFMIISKVSEVRGRGFSISRDYAE